MSAPKTPLHSKLTDLLACLRAVHWNAWTAHWRTAGPDFYSDHLLLQRIYEGSGGGPDIAAQIDGLGERIVALYGIYGIDPVAVEEKTLKYLSEVRGRDPLQAALRLEDSILALGSEAAQMAAKLKPAYSAALDNYLRSVVDERSTVVYLLKQRLGLSTAEADYGVIATPATSAHVGMGPVLGGCVLGAIAGSCVQGLDYKKGAVAGTIMGIAFVGILNASSRI